MNTYNSHAIQLSNVSKTYALYQNKWQQVVDVLGWYKEKPFQQFDALKNINITIKKGERIGIIGRNGAGKTTLLKLITKNFQPTSGKVDINGNVQALMSTGLGFHPEFSGLDNIRASLMYNGLSAEQLQHAIDDIIDFVELGDFLHQPLKTYSLGMQSRLLFAVSTAIVPEILIVDEILGAGDAYFSAKSADRMKKLTQNGCTLLLVSHSTAQVLQFCDKAIWLETGEVVMEGEAIEVVKAYEAYTKKLEMSQQQAQEEYKKSLQSDSVIQSKWLREKLLQQVLDSHNASQQSEQQQAAVSRWEPHDNGLKISDISVLDQNGQVSSYLETDSQATIKLTATAEMDGDFNMCFVILLFTEDGRWLSRHCSDNYHHHFQAGESFTIDLTFDRLLLGNGKYIFSAAIYSVFDLADLSTARYYDLLSRSFQFEVASRYKDDSSVFHHPATWQIADKNKQTQPQAELESV